MTQIDVLGTGAIEEKTIQKAKVEMGCFGNSLVAFFNELGIDGPVSLKLGKRRIKHRR